LRAGAEDSEDCDEDFSSRGLAVNCMEVEIDSSDSFDMGECGFVVVAIVVVVVVKWEGAAAKVDLADKGLLFLPLFEIMGAAAVPTSTNKLEGLRAMLSNSAVGEESLEHRFETFVVVVGELRFTTSSSLSSSSSSA
jgi:hypothetical protein